LSEVDLYSCLEIRGTDAQSFLQRQCSQDLSARENYAAFLTPKAEIIALAYIVRNDVIASPEGAKQSITSSGLLRRADGAPRNDVAIDLIVNCEHATTLKAHLEKFIILDDVTITIENDFALPAGIKLDDFSPKQQLMKIPNMHKYVSFTKGCYPGQEVVAKWSNAGQRKRSERAQRYLDEALSLHANSDVIASEAKQSTTSDGLLRRDAPRNDDAIELLRKSLQEDPQNEEAMEALGVMLARAQRYDEAIKVLQQLELINPKSIMAKANLSILYMKLGDKERAEQYKAEGTVLQFEQALKR